LNLRWGRFYSEVPQGRRNSKIGLFLATGLASVMLTSRLGSTRPSIATGGVGAIPGVALAALVMGLLTFGLGLLNVSGVITSIVVGAMLTTVIALPILIRKLSLQEPSGSLDYVVCVVRRNASVLRALPCRIWPIAHPSMPAWIMRHQMPGPNI
jgi:hypothetical protein